MFFYGYDNQLHKIKYDENGRFKTERLNQFNIGSDADDIVITVHGSNVYLAN